MHVTFKPLGPHVGFRVTPLVHGPLCTTRDSLPARWKLPRPLPLPILVFPKTGPARCAIRLDSMATWWLAPQRKYTWHNWGACLAVVHRPAAATHSQPLVGRMRTTAAMSDNCVDHCGEDETGHMRWCHMLKRRQQTSRRPRSSAGVYAAACPTLLQHRALATLPGQTQAA